MLSLSKLLYATGDLDNLKSVKKEHMGSRLFLIMQGRVDETDTFKWLASLDPIEAGAPPAPEEPETAQGPFKDEDGHSPDIIIETDPYVDVDHTPPDPPVDNKLLIKAIKSHCICRKGRVEQSLEGPGQGGSHRASFQP